MRSWPQIVSSSNAASSTVFANGPIWSRLDANAIEPVPADPPVRGLHPHHAAQRGRLADRAAGVRAERRAARSRRRPRPPIRRSNRRRPGRGRGGCGSTPNAEFSVDEPIANSSRLVLAIGIAPASASVLHDGGGVGRPPALEDPGRAGGGDAARAQVVLQRDGHPGQRDRGPRRAPPPRRPRRRRRSASSRSTELHAWISASRASIAARCSSTTDARAERVAGTDGGGDLARGRRPSSAHGASPRMRGTRNRPSSAAGACASTSSRSRVGRTSSARSTFSSGQRVGGGRDVVERERLDVGCVTEDRSELCGQVLDLGSVSASRASFATCSTSTREMGSATTGESRKRARPTLRGFAKGAAAPLTGTGRPCGPGTPTSLRPTASRPGPPRCSRPGTRAAGTCRTPSTAPGG